MKEHLIYDMKHGILKQYGWFMIVALLICCSCIQGYKYLFFDNILEYIMYAFEGTYLKALEVDDHFQVPVEWLSFYIVLAYIVGYYAEYDWKKRGMYCLLAGKSRTNWWLSKCCWCITCVFLYFSIGLLVIAIFTMVTGSSFNMNFSQDTMSRIHSGVIFLEPKIAFVISFILPFAVAVAVSMIQMLLSFFIGSVMSFAAVCSMYIISCYSVSPFFLGSYTMWLRNSAVIPNSGMDTGTGFFISATAIILVTMIGIVIFSKKDVLGVSDEA